jgi:hypothetical protein
MSHRLKAHFLANMALAVFAMVARGGIVDMLGEQDFADGASLSSSAEAANAGIGEVFPFDGTLFGHDDRPGAFGLIEYTHLFDPPSPSLTMATLTIGLIDHDSFPGSPPLDTIDLFFDGLQQPDGAFLGISIPDSSVSVVTIPIPIEFLLDGELRVEIMTTQPGREGNGGNSISIDFSRLEIVPDPTTLLLLGVAGAVLLRSRNR